jgi:hypothetical protein
MVRKYTRISLNNAILGYHRLYADSITHINLLPLLRVMLPRFRIGNYKKSAMYDSPVQQASGRCMVSALYQG